MSQRQKHYRCKNFIVSECAVSTALGFVIITGILVSAFCIIMAVQVPQMTKVSEAEHAAGVPQEFAEIDSAIDMAILRGGSSGSSGCRLEMMPNTVPVVGVHASAGTLVFNNSAEKFCFMACAPGKVPLADSPHPWNSTPSKFSSYPEKNKVHVVAQDYGAELELEFSEGNMIFDSGGLEELSGSFQCNKFEVSGGTLLYTANLIIYAREIDIESGSEITADGRGLSGGLQDEDGKGSGAGQNNAENNSAGGGGAGHGGVGGAGGANESDHTGGAGGIIYESLTNDKEALAGSGGGGGSTGAFGDGGSQIIAGEGGNGGAYLFLHAPIINIAGFLSVNGNSGGNGGGGGSVSAGGGGGGGSGGSILLKGDYVTVSGNLYANGGDGGDGGSSSKEPGGGGGGGAGGVIKIFNDSYLDDSSANYYVTGGEGGEKGKNVNNTKNGVDGENGSNTTSWIPYTQQVCYYATGYFESRVNDTNNSLVCYGNMTWNATTDADTNLIMKVRTSINKSMDENCTLDWDDCPPVINGTDISDLPSVSDGHQYIQWRAEFITFDLSKTPVLQWVNISYEYGIPFIVNTSGCIRYSSQYSDLRNFKLIYTHGATIKNQTEGELMVSDPPISISRGTQGYLNYTKLIITAINLTGSERETTGEFVTITPFNTNSELITGGLYYKNFSINITTDYPNVWEKWFTDTCEDAGLINGTDPGNYNISGFGTHTYPLNIAFYGDETRPIKIWLKSAEAGIKMKGDG